MFHLHPAAVGDTVLRKNFIYPLKGRRFVFQAPIRRAHHPLAGAANSHHVQPHSLGLSEGAGVERKSEVRIRFPDDAGSAAGRGSEFDDLDAQSTDDGHSGLVEFRGGAFGCATGIEGKFYRHRCRRLVIRSVCANIAYFLPP